MKTVRMNLQEGQKLEVEAFVSSEDNGNYTNCELHIDGLTLELYRQDLETIAYESDKALYDETRGDLEREIDKLRLENDRLRDEKNDLRHEVEELRDRVRYAV